MVLLLTADLHSKLRWFRWLESQAEKYELIGIAGDLLDLFSSVDPKTQSITATAFLRRLSSKTKVAVCSGNHDSIDYLANTRVTTPLWLSELKGIENLITDGQTQVLGNVVITSIADTDPWQPVFELPECWEPFDESQRAGKIWIWIHHIPPSGSKLSPDPDEPGDVAVCEMIEVYEPDIVLCGHHHHLVYEQENGWYDKLGKTLCINPGQSFAPLSPFNLPYRPNYLVLDTETRTVSWHAYSLYGLPMRPRQIHLTETSFPGPNI